MSFRLSLDSEQVQHVAFDDAFRVESGISVADAVAKMQEAKMGTALICREDSLIGILTERDIVQLMASATPFSTSVDDIMTKEPTTITPTNTIAEAIKSMSTGGYRQLPIVDATGSLLGVIKVSHILHYLVQHFPQSIYNLPPTPHHTLKSREGA